MAEKTRRDLYREAWGPKQATPEQPTVKELLEWIADAEHHPGCSGGYPNMRCKCGRREFDLPWGQDEWE